MATNAPMKVLAVGPAAGSIRELFGKIKAIDAKHGKFDLVLCAGDFFGTVSDDTEESGDDETSQLLAGVLEAPIECYIMQGDKPLPARVVEKFAKTGGEICKNVFLMSKSGIVTTASGLRIACLGGIYDPSVYASAEAALGFLSPFFSYHTTERLLSNTLTKASTSSQKSYSSLASIQAVASTSQLIDILLTNVWPVSVSQFSSIPLPDPQLSSIGAPPLNAVILKTKPRYHFAVSGGQSPKFWEREPFVWDDEQGRVSRFVSLGAFGGEPTSGKKQRWFYAFSISNTSGAEPQPRPQNATKNPLLEVAPRVVKRPLDMGGGENFIFGNVQQPQKRSRIGKSDRIIGDFRPGLWLSLKCKAKMENHRQERVKPPEGYMCKICNEPGHFVRDCPTKDATGDTGGRKPKPGYGERRGGKRGPPKEIAPDECWFCLSNPNLAKHLIVAIGSECYVTLPKGQIIPTQSATDHVDVPGGGHVLVIPITHYPTYTTIPPDLAPPIIEETEQFKTALGAMYAKYGCAAVVFEVGRLGARGGHAHIQAVPVPLRLKDKIEETFLQEGRAQGIDFEDDPEAAMTSCADGRGSYFKVELPGGRKMVHLLKDNVPFSIQFGRQVLVTLLGTPDRLDWRACMLSEEEDKDDAQAFKTAFASFNPSV
ncbi:nuclear protein [Crassisporium funariophilum]|nr:nuclear protein [Crassisporium funariophilum]